jgi:hypothetical protein
VAYEKGETYLTRRLENHVQGNLDPQARGPLNKLQLAENVVGLTFA